MNHFYQLLPAKLLLLLALHSHNYSYAQEVEEEAQAEVAYAEAAVTAEEVELLDLKFIGYEKAYPVFSLKKQLEFETMTTIVKLDDQSGESEVLFDLYDYYDILTYANGSYVGINGNGLNVIYKGLKIDLYADTFTDFDSNDRLEEMEEASNLTNIGLSPDGENLYFPLYSGLKIREYDLATMEMHELDFTELDEYGGFLLSPHKSVDKLLFLASIRGPWDLYEYDLNSKDIVKTPLTLGRGQHFGLEVHPEGREAIMMYKGLPIAYDFETQKFQKFDLPVLKIARNKGVESDFNKSYFSKLHQEWRYVTVQAGELLSMPIGLSDQYELSLDNVEAMIDASSK